MAFSGWHKSRVCFLTTSLLRSAILFQQDDAENTAARFSGDFYITGWRVTSRSSLEMKFVSRIGILGQTSVDLNCVTLRLCHWN